MNSKVKKLSISIAVLFGTTIAFAAISGDRLKSPVLVGQALVETLSIAFDTGFGAGNAKLVSTANTDLSLAVNGTNRVTATTSGASVTGTLSSSTSIKNADGSDGAPTYTFTNDTDTGFFREAAGETGYTANGLKALEFDDRGIRTQVGSLANPPFRFLTDTNTGMYQDGADALGFAAGGVRGLSVTATAAAIPGSLEMGGNGAFKIKIFTGSLGSSASTTLTNPGTVLLGALGASTFNGGTDYAPMDYDQTGGTATDTIRFRAQVPVSGGISIANYDTNSTNLYRVILWYQ